MTRPNTTHIDRTLTWLAACDAQREAGTRELTARSQELCDQVQKAMAEKPRLRGMKLISTYEEALSAHVKAAGRAVSDQS